MVNRPLFVVASRACQWPLIVVVVQGNATYKERNCGAGAHCEMYLGEMYLGEMYLGEMYLVLRSV